MNENMAHDKEIRVTTRSSKPTVKVVIHGSNKPKTKIFITSKKVTEKDQVIETKDVVVPESYAENNQDEKEDDSGYIDDVFSVQVIKKLRQRFERSSFDSGFFGNNNSSSTDDENQIASPRAESPTKIKHTNEKYQPEEKHSATFRCHPVYQPEKTTTAQIHPRNSSTSELGMIEENVQTGRLRRWGSVDLEPTQERFQYVPRSAEIKHQILQKSREQAKINSLNNNNTVSAQKMIRTQSCKQYPIQRTVVGAASPKFQKRASFGMTNKSRTVPSSPTPTIFDAEVERERIKAFTHALDTAAWRKKSSSFNN